MRSQVPFLGLQRLSDLKVARASWSELMGQINDGAPLSAGPAVDVLATSGGYVAVDLQNKWIQTTMHDVYVSMSVWGLVTGLLVALVVLLYVTWSVTIALSSVLCLAQVVGAVLASLSAMGWSIGIVESLCLILASGLSVDYVLHVACAYAQEDGALLSRAARTELALHRMGMPLLAGTATTLISGLSLSTCTFTVLQIIGAFMALAATWSYTLAQTLLPALLATVGPVRGPPTLNHPVASRSAAQYM